VVIPPPAQPATKLPNNSAAAANPETFLVNKEVFISRLLCLLRRTTSTIVTAKNRELLKGFN
jgi:hypothetical protein